MKNSNFLALTIAALTVSGAYFSHSGNFSLGALCGSLNVPVTLAYFICKTIEEAADKIVNGRSDSPRNIRLFDSFKDNNKTLDGYQGGTKRPAPASKPPAIK